MEDTYGKSDGSQNGVDGPDSGFLGLSQDVADSLMAAGDFFNFDKYSDRIPGHQSLESPGFDADVGVIAEKSRLEFSGMTAKAFFEANMEVGTPTPAETKDGYGYVTMRPHMKFRSELQPSSYQGTSGGGWWKVFAKTDDRRHLGRADAALWRSILWA